MAGKGKRGPAPIYGEAMLETVNCRFTYEMLEAIDEARQRRIDRPNRNQMIRELVAAALSRLHK